MPGMGVGRRMGLFCVSTLAMCRPIEVTRAEAAERERPIRFGMTKAGAAGSFATVD